MLHRLRLVSERLLEEVVAEADVVPGQVEGAAVRGGEGRHHDLDQRGPALGGRPDRPRLLRAQLAAQRRRLHSGEGQVEGAELVEGPGQLGALHGRQRRVRPARQHDRHLTRQLAEQVVEVSKRALVGDLVQVVQDQDRS